MTSSGMYIPTTPLTPRVPSLFWFASLYTMPISYPRNRALPVWSCVISAFSADRVSFSSVCRNEATLSLIWLASSKGPANPKRKSSAYRIYLNLLYPGSSGVLEGYFLSAFFRDCSRATGFIQPVHDEVMQGFDDGLQRGLHATYPARDVY